jgi:hypothetical protein
MSTQGIGIEIHATDAEQPNDNNTDWIADVYVEKYEGKVIVYGWNPKAVATGDDPSLNIPLVEDIDQARKLVQDEDNSEKEKQLYGHT